MPGVVVIAGNEQLFQTAVQQYYQHAPGQFQRTEVFEIPFIGKLEVLIDLQQAPRVDLKPAAGTAADFSVHTEKLAAALFVTPPGGQKAKVGEVMYKAGIHGNLVLRGNSVVAQNLQVSLDGPLDQTAEAVVNAYLQRHVGDMFQVLLPVAQLDAILGPGLSVTPLGLNVAGNMSSLRCGLGPSQVGAPALSPTPTAEPMICSAIDKDAINTVLRSVFQGVSRTAQVQGTIPLVLAWSVGGTVQAENLQVVSIAGPNATGSIDLRARLALKADPTGPLPAVQRNLDLAGAIPFTVQVQTDETGRKVQVRPLLGTPQISLPTNLPEPIRKMADKAEEQLRSLTENIVAEINQRFSQMVPALTLYEIPDAIPGMPVPVSLAFAKLAFEGNRLVANLKATF